jgi:hypothetical protein
MEMTGLPDIRQQITDIAGGLEDIENERDALIAKINDDPFLSAGSKAARAREVENEFAPRINNRINRLTLLQSAQQEARQQAQFAASTAINLFSDQRDFQQSQLEDELDRAEKFLEAEAKLQEPLSVSEAKALGVPFGTTREQAFGITPRDKATQELPEAPGTFINEFGETIQATQPKKAPNSGEQTSFRFFQRMKGAMDVIESLPDVTLDERLVQQALLNQDYAILKTPEQQVIAQAMRQFTEARLRQDSGAAIPPEEFVNDRRTYFPQFGEKGLVLERKAQARQETLNASRNASGKAYHEFYGQSPTDVGQRILREGMPGGTRVEPEVPSAEISKELEEISFTAAPSSPARS